MRSSSHSSNRNALDGKISRRWVIQTTEGEERHLEIDSRSDVKPVQLFAHRIVYMIATLTFQNQTCSATQHAVESIQKIRRHTTQNPVTIIQPGMMSDLTSAWHVSTVRDSLWIVADEVGNNMFWQDSKCAWRKSGQSRSWRQDIWLQPPEERCSYRWWWMMAERFLPAPWKSQAKEPRSLMHLGEVCWTTSIPWSSPYTSRNGPSSCPRPSANNVDTAEDRQHIHVSWNPVDEQFWKHLLYTIRNITVQGQSLAERHRRVPLEPR